MALRKCLNASLREGLRQQQRLKAPLYASVGNLVYDRANRKECWNNRACSEMRFFRLASSVGTSSVDNSEKLVLYRAKWMRPLRLMVRLKIFQLGGLAAFALPLAEYANKGNLSVGTLAAVTAVVGGAGAASSALWYYSRRYVGEMALVGPNFKHVQFSVVDFWGNREDNKYDIRDVLPPLKGISKLELEKAANQVLTPVDVIGGRQFFLSLRYGRLLQKELLFSLLHGKLDDGIMDILLGSKKVLEEKSSIHV